jgi:hypothetical protein
MYLNSLGIIKWVSFPYNVFEQETQDAAYYLLEGRLGKTTIMFDTFKDLIKYYHVHSLKNTGLVKHILMFFEGVSDVFRSHTMVECIEYCTKYNTFERFKDQVKTDTLYVNHMQRKTDGLMNIRNALKRRIETYLPKTIHTNKSMLRDTSLLDRLIDLSDEFMPSLKFTTLLQEGNYRPGHRRVGTNDVVNELHASFVPYCDIMLHHGELCARAKQTDSMYAKKMVSNSKDLLNIIEQ